MKKLIISASILITFMGLTAQERMIRSESVIQRRSEIQRNPLNPRKTEAVQFADSVGLPVRLIQADESIREIRLLNPFGNPEYLSTRNSNAAKSVSTDKVKAGGGFGYDLSGEGIVVGLWDGGIFRNTHVEFDDRARVIDVSADIVGHATHVAGTVAASGIEERAEGMAPESIIEGYDWDNDLIEMGMAASDGLLLSNHSYGFIVGWDYNSSESRWEWYGELDVSEDEEYLFGFYHREAQDYDRIAFKNPYYLIVKSAGNDRNEGPSPGAEHYVFTSGGWESSTDVRQKDGGADGFDSMGPVGNAKNILAVGAIKDLPLGYTAPENVFLTDFSAFGPSDDGRIKPDLVANGEALYSTYSASDTDYRNSSGTSMSAPNATGSLALIQEQHFKLYDSYLTSAALKGLVLHTADEAGNPGPDYKYGWGVLNTLSAVELISDESFDRVWEDSIAEGEEDRTWLYSNGTDPIRVTICWTDPPGVVPDAELNPVQRILINDMDLRLIREVDDHVFMPYMLDPIHPDIPAISGDNLVDNMEQVYIEAPQKGFYEIVISHKDELVNDGQNYAVIVSGLSDAFFASGENLLTDNNGEFIVTSSVEYLPEMNISWHIAPENNQNIKLYFDYFTTEAENDKVLVYDGADTSATLLASLDGELLTDTVEFESTSGDLFVLFSSDAQNQEKGFRAFYCTTPPVGVPTIQGEVFPCSSESELYLAGGPPGVEFVWTAPSGWGIDSTLSSGIILSVGNDSESLTVTAVNRCGDGMDSQLLLKPLESVPSLQGFLADTLPCAGSLSSVEVDERSGANYEWKLPLDWLGASVSNRLDYIPGKQSGSIRVISSNACGYGDTVQVPILVQDIPVEEQIQTVNDKPCAMSLQEFYIEPREDHSYSWSTIDDWTVVGDSEGDTVLVGVGEDASFLFVNVTNKCGSRQSNRLFITSPMPEDPLLQSRESEYEGYKELAISNAASYSGYYWYRDDLLIPGQSGNKSEYIAYLPGIYTVSVINNQGCENRLDPSDGISIVQGNQQYSIYAGSEGRIIILNSTNLAATANIYHFSGKLEEISVVQPGFNEIVLNRTGAYIVSVVGQNRSQSTRLFVH